MGVFDGIKDFFSGSAKKKLTGARPAIAENQTPGATSVLNPLNDREEVQAASSRTYEPPSEGGKIFDSKTKAIGAPVALAAAGGYIGSLAGTAKGGFKDSSAAMGTGTGALGSLTGALSLGLAAKDFVDFARAKNANNSEKKLNRNKGLTAGIGVLKGISDTSAGITNIVRGQLANEGLKAVAQGFGAATGALTVAEGLYKGGKEAIKLHRTRMFTPLSSRGLEWRKFIKNKQWSRLGVNIAKVTAGSLAIAGNVASMGALTGVSTGIGLGLTAYKHHKNAIKAGKEIGSAAAVAGNAVGEQASKAGSWIGDKAGKAGSWLGDKASKAGSWLGDKAGKAGSWLGDKAGKAGSWIGDKASKAGSYIGDKAGKAGSWIADKTKPARNWIADKTKPAREWIDNKTKPAREWVGEKAGQAADGLRAAGSWAGEKAGQTGEWIGEKAGQAADGFRAAGSWAGEKAGQAGEWIGEKAGQAADGLRAAGSWAGEKASAAGNWAADKAGKAKNWIGEKAEAVDNWAGGGRDKYWENMGMAEKRTPASERTTPQKLTKHSIAFELVEAAKKIEKSDLDNMSGLFAKSKDEKYPASTRKASADELADQSALHEAYDAAHLLQGLGVSLEMAKGDGDKVEELVRSRISVTGSI